MSVAARGASVARVVPVGIGEHDASSLRTRSALKDGFFGCDVDVKGAEELRDPGPEVGLMRHT